jgi:catechol 2,3-dioxygenase-like lactoylglutathione lyase family enzyme
MKIEHIAFNVANPVGMADWYCKHCGFKVLRHFPQPFQAHFISDSESSVLEIYCNPPDKVPDYRNMDPLLLHLALESSDPVADSQRLLAAGAAYVNETKMPDGSHIIQLRDPWGLALQLCKRARKL